MDNKFQILTIELDDGRVIKASIPAIIKEGEIIKIKRVQVTQPIEMSKGCHWVGIDDIAEVKNETN